MPSSVQVSTARSKAEARGTNVFQSRMKMRMMTSLTMKLMTSRQSASLQMASANDRAEGETTERRDHEMNGANGKSL